MGLRRHYRTKQQEWIITYLTRQKDVVVTAETLWSDLQDAGVLVGQTTVYRTLDRLAEEGTVIKVPAADGNRACYRYVGSSAVPSMGTMVCLKCGHTLTLECSHLEELTCHVKKDHEFEIDTRHTVLYGYCTDCTPQKH